MIDRGTVRLLRRLTGRLLAIQCQSRPGRGFASVPQARDHRANRQRITLAGDDLDQISVGVRLEDHVCLVALDLDQFVTRPDLVPLGLQPLQNRAFLHRVREPRHEYLVRHGQSRSSAAPTMLSASIAWWR
jgi:hypothetical protein